MAASMFPHREQSGWPHWRSAGAVVVILAFLQREVRIFERSAATIFRALVNRDD